MSLTGSVCSDKRVLVQQNIKELVCIDDKGEAAIRQLWSHIAGVVGKYPCLRQARAPEAISFTMYYDYLGVRPDSEVVVTIEAGSLLTLFPVERQRVSSTRLPTDHRRLVAKAVIATTDNNVAQMRGLSIAVTVDGEPRMKILKNSNGDFPQSSYSPKL